MRCYEDTEKQCDAWIFSTPELSNSVGAFVHVFGRRLRASRHAREIIHFKVLVAGWDPNVVIGLTRKDGRTREIEQAVPVLPPSLPRDNP